MKGFITFIVSLTLTLQVVICTGQTDPVEEYTIRIETKERNGRPIPATLTITNETTKKIQRGTLQSGSYTVALPAGSIYRLDANHTGYRPAQKMLHLDRVSDQEQTRQTLVLEMEREISTESPVNVTVVDYDTKQLIRQKLTVQTQQLTGNRVIMRGPPREGRFTFLAEFGQKVRFTVDTDGYQTYAYIVDVKDQHDIIIPMQRAGKPVSTTVTTTTEGITQAPAPTVTTAPGPMVTATPAPMVPAVPEVKPETSSSAVPALVNTDLSSLTTGKTVTLNNVYFDQSSYLLRPESYPQLNQLASLLKSRPDLRIEIAGHTDNVGDPRLNLALSENRARVITSYLITNGIPENRLRHKGYGQTQPIATNDTEENKRKNRRVEVRLLDK